MRITQQPSENEIVPYTTVKIDGCSDTVIGFQLLAEQPSFHKRRYCNKVLVHECVRVTDVAPLQLDRVEFLATDDPCYGRFNIFKSSDVVNTVDPTIELQLNDDDLVIGILVNFTVEETACQPIRMAFRMNGYDADNTKILLMKGNLLITPCRDTNCETVTWVDVTW